MLMNGKEFKPCDADYLASADGDVYSVRSGKILKHNIDLDGYHRVDIRGRHVKVHKIVYLAWIGPVPDGCQINHRNDDKDDNHWTNLYAGTQKQNIADCIRSGTRKGHMKAITVREKSAGKILSFGRVKDLIAHTGRKYPNGALSKLSKRKWFQDQYEIISVRA